MKLRDAEIGLLKETVKDLRQQKARLEDVELHLRLKTLEMEHHAERVQILSTLRDDLTVGPHEANIRQTPLAICEPEAQPRAVQQPSVEEDVAALGQCSKQDEGVPHSTCPLKRALENDSDPGLPTTSHSSFKKARTLAQINENVKSPAKLSDSSSVGIDDNREGSKEVITRTNAIAPDKSASDLVERERLARFKESTKGLRERMLARKAAKAEEAKKSQTPRGTARDGNSSNQTTMNDV
ncbi:MAG: hypothetical protein Q9180_008740 [Flavoplaca navasiana]